MPSPSGSTSAFGFPFLEETDVPDVATASEELAQAVENELLALTSDHAGVLALPFTVTGSPAAFLTTASLAVGTWLLLFNGLVEYGSTVGGLTDINIVTGSASATFTGPTATATGFLLSSGSLNFNGQTAVALSTIATVTAAGTIEWEAAGSGGTTILTSSLVERYTGATGYTAIRQA